MVPSCSPAQRFSHRTLSAEITMRPHLVWFTTSLFAMFCIGMLHHSNAAAQENARPASAISILAWNMESPGSDPEVIAKQLDSLQPFDIFALSEVPENATKLFTKRWGEANSFVGATGGPSRLVIGWNPQVLDAVNMEELKAIDGKGFGPGNQIAPLMVHFKTRSSPIEFKLVMNKLTRGSGEVRKTQALLLSQWGKAQQVPCVAVGGYNFDYNFKTEKGNASFDAFLETKVWNWIKPKELIDNNWADSNRDGQDDYPDSILDYTFTANWESLASKVEIKSEVVVRESDFPDNDETSDHRPLRTTLILK